MRKIYLAFVFISVCMSAGAQCTVDPSAQTSPGISPRPSALACVKRSTAYNEVLQVKCPVSYDSSYTIPILNTHTNIKVTIDSMELTQVIGLPSGINWFRNTARLRGGQNGCVLFTGRTAAAPGNYPIEWYGTVWGTIAGGLSKQTYTGSLNKLPEFDYYLTVIAQGQGCEQTGIDDLTAALDASWSLYPNPSNGTFECRLSEPMNAEIQITDVTGRIVYTSQMDESKPAVHIDMSTFSKGLYVAHLRTAMGSAARVISIE